MYKIELTNNSVKTCIGDRSDDGYVFYTGGIAGISDAPSQTDSKPLDRGADEVEFDRH
jgi:hypothetical protein